LPFAGFEAGRCPQLTETAPPAGCSDALDRVIAMCLERDPARRPTMVAIAEMLRADERMTQDVGALAIAPAAKRRRWPILAAAGAAIVATAYLLVPGSPPATPLPLPVLPVLPAVAVRAAAPAPQPRVEPASHPPERARTRPRPAPIARRAGETLD